MVVDSQNESIITENYFKMDNFSYDKHAHNHTTKANQTQFMMPSEPIKINQFTLIQNFVV